MFAPMAQLDRASDYGSEGWGFESFWVRQDKNKNTVLCRVFVFTVGTTEIRTQQVAKQRRVRQQVDLISETKSNRYGCIAGGISHRENPSGCAINSRPARKCRFFICHTARPRIYEPDKSCEATKRFGNEVERGSRQCDCHTSSANNNIID